MTGSSEDMLKLILETKALSVWNREKGPIFWYTAGVPGPFFVNTEWIIGRDLASLLVDDISTIIDATSDFSARAKRLDAKIMAAYQASPQYKQVITALAKKTQISFPVGSYAIISGGERRDWLFSIPLAHELGIPHAYLFKDQNIFCDPMPKADVAVLHVADLINNAASYFDRWFPALEKAKLKCHATICVNSRGNGAEKLEKTGVKVASLARIDVSLFEQLRNSGLVNQDTLDEMAIHARSPAEWAEKYLIGKPDLFDVPNADKKSFERMQSFFMHDPWSLRAKYPEFFREMDAAIAARQNKDA